MRLAYHFSYKRHFHLKLCDCAGILEEAEGRSSGIKGSSLFFSLKKISLLEIICFTPAARYKRKDKSNIFIYIVQVFLSERLSPLQLSSFSFQTKQINVRTNSSASCYVARSLLLLSCQKHPADSFKILLMCYFNKQDNEIYLDFFQSYCVSVK